MLYIWAPRTHLVEYLHLHPDIHLTFNHSTICKEVLLINFELLEPNLATQVNTLFIEISPTSFNVPFKSNPEGLTSRGNLFQTVESTSLVGVSMLIAKVGDSMSNAKVNRIGPPVTKCLVNASRPGGL